MEKVIIAYIPVIHRGYLNYFASTGAKKIYALQVGDLPGSPQLAREIRALSCDELSKALSGLGYEVLPFSEWLGEEHKSDIEIYVPKDDVTKDLVLEGNVIYGSAFLRWDWTKSTAVGFVQPEADRIIKSGDQSYTADSSRMQEILAASCLSSDWWRQVGAMVVAAGGKKLIAYNKHFPNEYAPYMDGDPRDNFSPGEFIEVSTALHGERALIARAAAIGLALVGGEMYVTTFPCNDCANWIVEAGIKRVFFLGGYSNLNGQKTLRNKGVELVYVEL